MKLYSAANSNFGARVAIAARAKGITIEEAPIPVGGLRSDAFRALNPIARIPVLCLEDGTVLPESETILRYLEARFHGRSLYPSDPAERARIDRSARVMDYYVMAPVIRLFPHLDPAQRDAELVRQEVARWRDGLAALAHFMDEPLPETPAGVSVADCVLIPSLHLCTRIAAMLHLPEDPTTHHEGLVAYYRRSVRHPVIAPVIDALTAAQEIKDAQSGLPSLAGLHRLAAGLAHPEFDTGDNKP